MGRFLKLGIFWQNYILYLSIFMHKILRYSLTCENWLVVWPRRIPERRIFVLNWCFWKPAVEIWKRLSVHFLPHDMSWEKYMQSVKLKLGNTFKQVLPSQVHRGPVTRSLSKNRSISCVKYLFSFAKLQLMVDQVISMFSMTILFVARPEHTNFQALTSVYVW